MLFALNTLQKYIQVTCFGLVSYKMGSGVMLSVQASAPAGRTFCKPLKEFGCSFADRKGKPIQSISYLSL